MCFASLFKQATTLSHIRDNIDALAAEIYFKKTKNKKPVLEMVAYELLPLTNLSKLLIWVKALRYFSASIPTPLLN